MRKAKAVRIPIPPKALNIELGMITNTKGDTFFSLTYSTPKQFYAVTYPNILKAINHYHRLG